jgi:preprotein translocase subunit SecD
MFCPKCGLQNNDNAFKCVGCGTIIQVVPPPIVSVKKSNAPIIILITVLGIPVVMFLIGIVAAIAIPQFTAYRNRVGGSQLILDVKTDKAIENHIVWVVDELENNLNQKQIPFQELVPKGTIGIDITLIRKEDENVFKDLVIKDFRDFDFQPLALKENQKSFQLILRDQVKMHIKKLAYEQTLTIIRNRLDALGIRRNNTRSEEETRILVQLPRLKDPQKAIDLIVKPALLEFKLVDEENMASADWQNKLPLGDEILYETEINDKGDRAKRPWLLKQRTLLNGEYLKDAKQTISSQTNRSMVSLSFDSQGAKKFEKITADNIGKRLAIVLDDVVYSAPNIQEKISGGNAVITGNFSDEEAKNLAMVLRAGALPVPVEVIENRPTGSSPVVLK